MRFRLFGLTAAVAVLLVLQGNARAGLPEVPIIPINVIGEKYVALKGEERALLKERQALLSEIGRQNAECRSVKESDVALKQKCVAWANRLRDRDSAYRNRVKELDEKISRAEAESIIAAPETRSQLEARYLWQDDGIILGTGKTFDSAFRISPREETPERRRIADQTLRWQMEKAGLGLDEFIAIKDYDFIIGLAVSSNEFVDLKVRVLQDQLSSGRATPEIQLQYNRLKGKSFGSLDCHSNGAMICLAALRNGDITARKVRLLGPQITPGALAEWEQLLDPKSSLRIDDLEIVVNEKDPVPVVSYLWEQIRERVQDDSVSDQFAGRAPLGLRVDPQITTCDGLRGCRTYPGPKVRRLPCDPGFLARRIGFSLECHYIGAYRRGSPSP